MIEKQVNVSFCWSTRFPTEEMTNSNPQEVSFLAFIQHATSKAFLESSTSGTTSYAKMHKKQNENTWDWMVSVLESIRFVVIFKITELMDSPIEASSIHQERHRHLLELFGAAGKGNKSYRF